MSQHLTGIALPFAVLCRCAFYRVYLAGGDEVFQFFRTSHDGRGDILAKGQPVHHPENILQGYLCRIDRRCESRSHHDTRVTKTHLSSRSNRVFQFFPLHCSSAREVEGQALTELYLYCDIGNLTTSPIFILRNSSAMPRVAIFGVVFCAIFLIFFCGNDRRTRTAVSPAMQAALPVELCRSFLLPLWCQTKKIII